MLDEKVIELLNNQVNQELFRISLFGLCQLL